MLRHIQKEERARDTLEKDDEILGTIAMYTDERTLSSLDDGPWNNDEELKKKIKLVGATVRGNLPKFKHLNIPEPHETVSDLAALKQQVPVKDSSSVSHQQPAVPGSSTVIKNETGPQGGAGGGTTAGTTGAAMGARKGKT